MVAGNLEETDTDDRLLYDEMLKRYEEYRAQQDAFYDLYGFFPDFFLQQEAPSRIALADSSQPSPWL